MLIVQNYLISIRFIIESNKKIQNCVKLRFFKLIYLVVILYYFAYKLYNCRIITLKKNFHSFDLLKQFFFENKNFRRQF